MRSIADLLRNLCSRPASTVAVLALAAGFLALPLTPAVLTAALDLSPSPALAQDIEVDLDVDENEWFENPLWLAVIALVIIIVVVMAMRRSRRGGPR